MFGELEISLYLAPDASLSMRSFSFIAKLSLEPLDAAINSSARASGSFFLLLNAFLYVLCAMYFRVLSTRLCGLETTASLAMTLPFWY